MIVVIVFVLFYLLYRLYTKDYNYWSKRGIPYEKPFFIFGNFYEVATRKMHVSKRLRHIYDNFKNEPYVGIYMFNKPNLLVRDPELLKSILVQDFNKFMNRDLGTGNESVDPLTAHALFTSKGENWRSLRKKITPAFSSGKIKLMFPIMKSCALELEAYLKNHNNGVVETESLAKKYAVDIICSCVFGINAYCIRDEKSKLFQMATNLINLNSIARSISNFCFFFLPHFYNIFRLSIFDKTAVDYLQSIFTKTMRERESQNITKNDFMDVLIDLRKTGFFNDNKFGDIKIAAQAISFFSAGNDTTSATLAFCFYELAANPEIQNRLRNELCNSYQLHGEFTYEGLQEIKYLDMVLSETLRKYPVATTLNRQVIDNFYNQEIGLSLEKDLSILIPVCALHMDPKYYPEPEKFDPERFSQENKDKIVPYAYMPFGAGPRNCIGQRFAMLTNKIALAYCVKNFVFESLIDEPLSIKPTTVLPSGKDGINLKIRAL